ncbi:MAG: F0F1 ATP synthase subunit delta, partial [Lachnospiraceae bacterium]|nr:F0F1 ATP synthase subunit delta [Lachnospiraceae bacterium]
MSEMKAVLLSASAPSFEQEQRFTEFIHREYGPDVSLEWIQDNSIVNGFQLKVGEKIYDWTREGLYEQLSRSVDKRKYAGKELIPLIKNALTDWEAEALPAEKGTVITVGDGIAHIKGLENAEYGEILVFESGIRGMVLDLTESLIGCIIFGDDEEILAGSSV